MSDALLAGAHLANNVISASGGSFTVAIDQTTVMNAPIGRNRFLSTTFSRLLAE